MNHNLLKNFSNNYKEALIKAINLAWSKNIETVKPEHILEGLVSQKGCIGSEILIKANYSPKQNKTDNISNLKNTYPSFDLKTIEIIEASASIAFRHNHPFIATEHLLLALIENQDTKIKQLFDINKVNQKYIRDQLAIIFNSDSKFQNFTSSINDYENNGSEDDLTAIYTPTQIEKKSVLENLTIDLTDKKIQKNIDPVIGRDPEIDRLTEILLRRTKNNPLILGDPGVGKTAIVEGLAKKISKGEVPEILANKKLLSLDISSIVAGTMFRGEFENRMKNILEEIKKDPNIIIFIDEIHNIIGAGSTQGSMDIANIIKPALARGEIRCIGATTYEEYKKHLEGDVALERRFQLVKVKEPNKNETKKIIQGVKTNYEDYHNVTITDEAIISAIELSEKYITDRFFPDKALDLIDEAASKIKIKQKRNRLDNKLKLALEKLEKIKQAKEEAVIEENFKQAVIFKAQERNTLEEINNIKKLINSKDKKNPQIGKKEICQTISKITNIPLKELLLEEKQKFINLEKLLAQKIIAQDQALEILSSAIRRAKAGINRQNKPLGSFIFIGPSGSGKTYTSKILSEILFDTKDSLIRIDMSEFSEKFNISKLIGAPAGYVGYKESGKLTDSVKRNPNSIVLFDEIEKAHPDIFNLLLQILDEGYLTDAVGKKINFKNTIIIMTSNLGNDKLDKKIGFDNDENSQNNLILEKELRNFFRPEFINRLDKIIFFNNLTQEQLKKIARLELDQLIANLKNQKIELSYDNKILKNIVNHNYRPELGARLISQNIEELIASPLSHKIFSTDNNKFHLALSKNNIEING